MVKWVDGWELMNGQPWNHGMTSCKQKTFNAVVFWNRRIAVCFVFQLPGILVSGVAKEMKLEETASWS